MRKFWMVYVFDMASPAKRYYDRKGAENDAKKLCRKEGKTATILEVVQAIRPVVEVVTDFEGAPQKCAEVPSVQRDYEVPF